MGKLVCLTTFHNRHEAEMMKERLLDAGIGAFVQADDGMGLLGGQTFAKGVEVMIDESDLEEAKALVDSEESGSAS